MVRSLRVKIFAPAAILRQVMEMYGVDIVRSAFNKGRCVRTLSGKEPHRRSQHLSYGTLQRLTRYSDQREQFRQCSVTENETWVNHEAPKTKKAAMMWKQPPSSPAKKVKATPLIRNITEIVFCKREHVLFVGFLNRGDDVTAEHCCGALKR
ncbi:hypothetical protein Cfor_10756 [Coptotermes formosanus]|uniref:Uncharacterized protein n=1 Tax=Coptotermes formosanus TaxID=36987 RepID=A0A6L2PHI5_COPFO|nr:hypothetical protein Cfor_10756 [Coptotermes formosanus]